MSDPPPHERTYYRHVETGQRAYVVQREGYDKLRIDRGPNEEAIVPLDPARWTIDKDVRPINAHHLGEVAFAADRVLCLKLALHREARLEWANLSQAERNRFMKHGPGDEYPVRAKLFAYITKALEPYTSK